LHVSLKEQKQYQHEKNLSTLLIRLHQDGHDHQHLAFLLDLLQTSRYTPAQKHHWGRWAMSALVIGVGTYLNRQRLADIGQFLTSTLPKMIATWLEKRASLLFRGYPLAGAAATLVSLLWAIYTTFYHGFTNLTQKATSLFFKVLSKGLTFAAYVVCFFAAGVPTPLTGWLFVAGTAIDMADVLTSFIFLTLKHAKHKTSDSPSWHTQADDIRRENQREHAKEAVWVKLTASFLTTITVAIWCFAPPSIPITLACIGAMMLIGLAKSNMMGYINTKYANLLQTSLASLTDYFVQKNHTFAHDDTHKMAAILSSHLQIKPNVTPSNKPAMPEKYHDARFTQQTQSMFFSPQKSPEKRHDVDDECRLFNMYYTI
jgi:hypothetical protein